MKNDQTKYGPTIENGEGLHGGVWKGHSFIFSLSKDSSLHPQHAVKMSFIDTGLDV